MSDGNDTGTGPRDGTGLDPEALETLIKWAHTCGAEGVWILRGAVAGRMVFAFPEHNPEAGDLSIRVAAPHQMMILIRIPVGDGGEAGIESR